MTNYLFDTGAIIDIFHGRERIRPYFQLLQIQSPVYTYYLSTITEAELWRGLRQGELDKHNLLISRFVVLPVTSQVARLAGSFMQKYQKEGLGWMDALITATAHDANSVLLTRDKRLAQVLSTQAKFELYQ